MEAKRKLPALVETRLEARELFFTARRYASAVYAVTVVVCLSVRLSVCHKSRVHSAGQLITM